MRYKIFFILAKLAKKRYNRRFTWSDVLLQPFLHVLTALLGEKLAVRQKGGHLWNQMFLMRNSFHRWYHRCATALACKGPGG